MATTPIPIRSVTKNITPNGANYVLLDDGVAMGKASLTDAVTTVAGPLADTKIAALNLDTASTYAATDFATAAQGTKADSAIQPSAIGDSVQAHSNRLQSLTDATGVEGQVPNLKADGTFELADAGSGDMRKNVFDPTGKEADAFDQDNMVDGTTNKNYTATEKTKVADAVTKSDTRAAMLALSTALYPSSWLLEGGRVGLFLPDSSDLSSILVDAAITSTAVNSGTGVITKTAHGLRHLCAVIVTSAVNGLATNTIYWVSVVDADTFKLCPSIQNAFAGTSVTLTGTTNFSVRRHYDPMQGWFVTPASDLSGASGAWRRKGAECINIEHFGAVRGAASLATSSAAAIQGAFELAGRLGGTVRFPACNVGDNTTWWLSDTDLYIPLPASGSNAPMVEIEGSGWSGSVLAFAGSGVTKGLYLCGNSATYPYAGTVRNLRIQSRNIGGAAKRGFTAEYVNHARLERVTVNGFAGCGTLFKGAIAPSVDNSLLGGNGSSTEPNVQFDGCTMVRCDHIRVSGGNAGVIAGIMVDDCIDGVVFINPEVESSGIPYKISSIAGRTLGVEGLVLLSAAAENIGNGNPYVEIGNGWTGSAGGALKGGSISISGSASGTTSMLCTVWAANTTGLRVEQDNCTLISPTARYILDGSNNRSFFAPANRGYFGLSYPWITVNGTMKKDATPVVDCLVDGSLISPPVSASAANVTGTATTVSLLLSAAQGGWFQRVAFNHSAATNFLSVSDAPGAVEVTFVASNGNTTLKHDATGSNTFVMTGGADLTMVANRPYKFYFNGTRWYQIGT